MTNALSDANDAGGIVNSSWAASQPGYTGKVGIYAGWATVTDSLNAGFALLNTSAYNGLTIQQATNRWVTGSASNTSPALQARAEAVAKQLGVSVNTPLSQVSKSQFLLANNKQEDSNFDPATYSSWAAGKDGTATFADRVQNTINGDEGGLLSGLANYTGLSAAGATAINVAFRGFVIFLAIVIVAVGLYFLLERPELFHVKQ